MSPELQAMAGVLSGVVSAVLLGMFIGLWMWVYGARRRQKFDEASRIPLEEDSGPGTALRSKRP